MPINFDIHSTENRIGSPVSFRGVVHFLLLAFLLFIPLTGTTYAKNEVVHLSASTVTRLQVEYLKAEHDDHTWQSINSSTLKENWQQSNTNINAIGYYDGTVWARIRIQNDDDNNEWRLRIPNPFIQYLDVFVINEQGKLQSTYQTGSHRPAASRPIHNRYFVFPFEVEQHKQITLLIKIKSQFGIFLPSEIYTENAFNEMDVSAALWLGSFLGIILVMAAYNIFLYFSTRQLAYLCYVIFVVFNFLYQASHAGIGAQMFWPGQYWIIEQSFYFFSVMTFLTASVFIYVFLDLNKDGIFLRYFSYFLINSWIIIAVASFFIDVEITANICNILGLTSCLFALSLGIYKYFLGVEIAKYFTIAWFTMVSATLLVILKYIGVWPNLTHAEMIQKVGTVVEVILLSLALGVKIKQLRQEKQSAQLEASEAQRQNKAKSTFLATMSHEIRTPINGVLGITDLLLETPLNKQQNEWLNHIKSSGETLLTVINDILDYSKIEAGKLEVESIPFSIPDLVSNCSAVLRPQSEKKGIRLQVDIDKALQAPLLGDPTRIRQMLLNYLSNAFKFTDKGSITIKAELIHHDGGEPYFRILVIDEGIGIDSEKCQSLFTEFTQAETNTTRQFGGTGLGLSITKRLAELMGGSVGVKSEIGKGSTFWFEIPFKPATEVPLSNQPDTTNIASLSDFNLKVLIAEDNKVNQVVIKAMVSKMGIEMDLCENGEQAVEQFKNAKGQYHLILMDCEMPILNGFEASRFIRAYERVKGFTPIPIIALTAHAMQETHQECFASGMWDVVVKPIDRETLAEKIRYYSDAGQAKHSANNTHL